MRLILPLILLLLGGIAHAASVPAGLLQVPDSVATILVADTAAATLRRYAHTEQGLVEIDSRYMSIGRNGVGKQRAWDRRTPLGIYFITEELDTSRLHDKYGDKAFVLDYPNAWDQSNKRTGDGIWLHGVDPNEPDRPALDTDGCLALTNESISELASKLAPLVTPVIVTRKLVWTDAAAAAAQRQKLLDGLRRWEQSVEQNNVQDYLALYGKTFSFRGMSRADWVSWRSRVFLERTAVQLEIDDLLLLADPEEEGLFLSRFTQRVQTADSTVVTQKRLYWRYDDAGELRIVAEDNG